MESRQITLDSIDKLFEYEKQVRIIDELSSDELKEFAKLYCKLYLKQQETLLNLINIENINI